MRRVRIPGPFSFSPKSPGIDYLHIAVNDHPSEPDYAYVELLPDEKGATTTGFVKRATAYFWTLGVRIKRILTDNGKNYTNLVVRAVATARAVALTRARPCRPQTNVEVEALIKILGNE